MRRLLPVLLAVLLAVLLLPAPAAAKFRIGLAVDDATPRVGQLVRVAVTIPPEAADGAVMRLVAVPPGMNMYDAIDAEPLYAIPLVRRGATWRGSVRFRRPGRWRLVVPNWGAPGYAIPPPVIRTVRVGA